MQSRSLLVLTFGGSMDPHIKKLSKNCSAPPNPNSITSNTSISHKLVSTKAFWREQPSTAGTEQVGTQWKFLRAPMVLITNDFFGDASMSPYEIAYPDRANELGMPKPDQLAVSRARAVEQQPLRSTRSREITGPTRNPSKMVQEIFGRMPWYYEPSKRAQPRE